MNDFNVVSTIADALGIGHPDTNGRYSKEDRVIWNKAIDIADALYDAHIVERP